MNISDFFNLLKIEIAENEELQGYYDFSTNKILSEVRKNYFCNRLKYIENQIKLYNKSKEHIKILDCGCGYGTISLYFAINGYKVDGVTIGEHYINGIEKRKDFWNKFGDILKFSPIYEYLPDMNIAEQYDIVILQDTLHHLEPIDKCVKTLHTILKSQGKLIVTEANGANPFHSTKNYLRRKNETICEVYDKILGKNILYGDENFKSLREWKKLFSKNKFTIEKEIEYVKILPFINRSTEKLIANLTPGLREYLFFAFNFTVVKNQD